MKKPFISVVSPVYKAEKMIPELVQRIASTVEKITEEYEIILVDDRSPDQSWQVIKDMTAQNNNVKGFKLSKNFGQHYAITTGLEQSTGDWVVVMDCDLQDMPEEILNLFKKTEEGFDAVLASRVKRKDGRIKKFFSRLFHICLTYLTGTDLDAKVGNFGIYNRKMIDSICTMKESIRYFPAMVKWVGFNVGKIDVKHAKRAEGETTYNFRKLLLLALDIMLAYSDKPIRLVIKFGLLIAATSFIFAIYTLFLYLFDEIEVIGYSSLIISIWFLSGCILVTLGMIGLYVGKIFEGVKNRPVYIIDEKV